VAVLISITVVLFSLLFWAIGSPQLWHFQIRAYEKADQTHPPQPGVIVFTGSSSIRLWQTLEHDMQPLAVINRGFGGSQLAHASYYAPRIITPYHPRAVVLYAGDNDLSIGRKSPETVLRDFQQFVSTIQASLPQTWIYYISIKPSPGRNWAPMQRTNGMIAAYIRTCARVQLIDVSSAMLDVQGNLRRELYGRDPIHMDASGYELWTSIVKPVLMHRFAVD
jgi:lysophospholipase L1-like esterase